MRNSHSMSIRSIAAAFILAIGFVTSAFGASDVKLTILQTTDLHHHANGADHVGLDVDPVNGTSALGAYARIAAYVNYVRSSAGHPVILVDSGDWTMGTLYDLTLGSQPLALQFLELMRYDCVTLGNHEFDYGAKGLAQILANAQSTFGLRTPIVASNMDLGGNADLAPFVGRKKAIQTTHIQTLRDGITIGYIGLMGRGAGQAAAAAAAPVKFIDPATQYAAIQALVDKLRNDDSVQIVIALSHSGTDPTGTSGEDIELARHVRGIDVIASGHTHTPLASARTVANGAWNTRIINAGAFGTNVSRLDLTYHRAKKTTTVDASSNPAMTDANLATIQAGLVKDTATTVLVNGVDHQINVALGGFLAQTFPDYDAALLGKGIYHPVGTTAQDMESNENAPVPPPNGLGSLAADALRTVPNALIAQTLAAVGGNPANLPGYDFNPVQLNVVLSVALRGTLRAGVALSFADVYNVLPMGISPDPSQALPIGSPMVSAYLEIDDVKKLAALQLVLMSGLGGTDALINFSGIGYDLDATGSYLYFKSVTAAAVLQLTSQKATTGSVAAAQALAALASLGSDNGAALLSAAAGNPFAAAMVKLNDPAPSSAQIAANLAALGQVAAAASAGTSTLTAFIVSKAIAAIGTVYGFSPADPKNIGAASPLPAARVRVAADLPAIVALGALLQARFGFTITAYQAATGPTTLSDLATLLGNRIDALPAAAGVQELKGWMALLSYLGNPLGGFVSPEYFSTSNFLQFPTFGLAVRNRNAGYPLPSLGLLAGTLATLNAAP